MKTNKLDEAIRFLYCSQSPDQRVSAAVGLLVNFGQSRSPEPVQRAIELLEPLKEHDREVRAALVILNNERT